jgi:GntR family transcriptional regulator of gluconate operon
MPTSGHAKTLLFRDRWEVVHDVMRDEILKGAVAPGSRILETELAERLGVSRGPIREALRVLEVEGLVERRSRQGSFVSALREQDVEEIYSLRLAVESLAVRRAIERADAQFEARLESHLEDVRIALRRGDHASVVEPDIAFHGEFYIAADHQRLLNVWQTLQGPLRRLVSLTASRGKQDYKKTTQGHVAILSAVRQRDADATALALEQHLREGQRIVLEFLHAQTPRK